MMELKGHDGDAVLGCELFLPAIGRASPV